MLLDIVDKLYLAGPRGQLNNGTIRERIDGIISFGQVGYGVAAFCSASNGRCLEIMANMADCKLPYFSLSTIPSRFV